MRGSLRPRSPVFCLLSDWRCSMARAYQVVGLLFLALGLFVLYYSWTQLRFFTRLGPGSGFFGVWLGGLLSVLAVLFIVRNTLPRWRPDGPLELLPPGEARMPVLVTVACLVLTVGLLPLIGFRLTVLGLSMVLLLVVGRQPLWVAGVVSVLCSVGIYYVFTNLLGVVLPSGIGGF